MPVTTETTPARRLVTAREAAKIVGCSWRTIYRLADAGKFPAGVKIGALRRWDINEIHAFVDSGCKPVRQPKKGGR